jgi:hypothetical protein
VVIAFVAGAHAALVRGGRRDALPDDGLRHQGSDEHRAHPGRGSPARGRARSRAPASGARPIVSAHDDAGPHARRGVLSCRRQSSFAPSGKARTGRSRKAPGGLSLPCWGTFRARGASTPPGTRGRESVARLLRRSFVASQAQASRLPRIPSTGVWTPAALTVNHAIPPPSVGGAADQIAAVERRKNPQILTCVVVPPSSPGSSNRRPDDFP